METIKQIDKEKPLLLIEMQRKMNEIYTETQNLANSPQNIFKEQELALMVNSLRNNWNSIEHVRNDLPTEAFSSLESIFTTGNAATQKGFDFVKAFYNLINESVFFELSNWLNSYIYIYI